MLAAWQHENVAGVLRGDDLAVDFDSDYAAFE
jgi:hypothetical protein